VAATFQGKSFILIAATKRVGLIQVLGPMKSRVIASLTVALVLAVLSVIVYRSMNACGISKASAMAMIRADMRNRGLDPRFLGPLVRDTGGCTFSAQFEGSGQKIEYAVYDDAMHGPELGVWDFHRQGNGP
jgi:hypothetical protein